MKFFLDAHLFDGFGQGSRTFLSGIYSSLIERRPDIDFNFAAYKPQNLTKEFGSHANTHYLSYYSKNKFLRLGHDIPSLIKRNKIEVANFQYISPLVQTCSEICTIHDVLFLEFPDYFPLSYRLVKNYLFKRSAQRADYILTISQYSKASLIRNYNLPPEKIEILPCGVLDSFLTKRESFGKRDEIPTQPYLLYVSRFEPRKNQAGLLKAWLDLDLRRKGIQLVFIGTPGVDSPEFTKLYDGLNDEVKMDILFKRDISEQELRTFYENCLLFVYPSFAEGFGIPPLEAVICGANTICSNLTSMEEFTFFGNRHFDPRNESEFRDKILHFIDHPPSGEEQHKMVKAIEENFTWKRGAEIYSKNVLNRYTKG